MIASGSSSDPAVKIGAPAVSRINASIGDSSVGFAFKITASKFGVKRVLYGDALFVQRGRAVVMLSTLSIDMQFDPDLEVALLKKMVKRLDGGRDTKPLRAATVTPSTPLSAAALRDLVVIVPPPFVKVPDAESNTGLLEFGNPNSAKIDVPFVTAEDLRVAKFQRGWDKIYGAPNGASILVGVLQFASTRGPEELSAGFSLHREAGFHQRAVQAVPDATAQIGPVPEGRSSVSTMYPLGRFLVIVIVVGPPGVYDYDSLLDEFARIQRARLP